MRYTNDLQLKRAPVDADREADADDGVTRDPAIIEAGLVKIFRELFQFDDLGPDDDFFALGGDSLLAVTLMSGIEREFTSVIPISVLLEAPTPKLLAGRIVDDLTSVPPTSLVPVRTEGAGSPVFCIHGMGGEALFCRRLSPVLLPSRPVYGLRAIGLQNDEVPLTSVPTIAASYLLEIKKVQDRGPYIILGQCGTSSIAFEVAQQLHSSGDEIAGLILLDPSTSDYAPWLVASGMRLSLLQAEAVERGRKIQEWAYSARGLSGKDRRKLVREALSAAIGSYVPKPLDVEGLMLCSTTRIKKLMNAIRGYPSLINRLEVHNIDAPHMELFLDFYMGRKGKFEETVSHINSFLNRVALV